ncbi:MAG TPA: hypothetical protein VN982_14400 [Candidatus Dormibacteraeota bacterium]|nr:hypothetical protein [Candidatus Dormibacteraeota bacterium]
MQLPPVLFVGSLTFHIAIALHEHFAHMNILPITSRRPPIYLTSPTPLPLRRACTDIRSGLRVYQQLGLQSWRIAARVQDLSLWETHSLAALRESANAIAILNCSGRRMGDAV